MHRHLSAQAGERMGLVQVYTGDGKGKTTAALGLALRAAGHGLRTYIGQFIKGWETGELKGAELLVQAYLTIEQFGDRHFVLTKGDPQQAALARRGLRRVRHVLLSDEYDIVVLDEINVALTLELVSLEDVLALLEERPSGVELVLTGRGAPQELISRADLVTEMVAVKHPYDRGIKARPGIEF
ncbi:MAG: cob(I)yrinic acid a,c-diamide adenosyltransferase [Chloroflexota bacterium]|nr:cob(I)yrinic acid a,c-diamide adenosyltransferase [Chloroflexota bacterium]